MLSISAGVFMPALWFVWQTAQSDVDVWLEISLIYQLAFQLIVFIPDVELGPSILQGGGSFETFPSDLKGAFLVN